MWVIAYITQQEKFKGWCVVDVESWAVKAGPYPTHQEAVEAAQTMAWRVAQGWAP
jgi:hypothetical protein